MSRSERIPVGPALVAIVLTGLNLRIAIIAVGPLINQIQSTTGMSSALAGLLTTIPFFFMGISVLFGGPLIRRYGPRKVILIGLITLSLGCLLRSLTDETLPVVAGTVPVGIGVSLMGLALPPAVKQFTPQHAGMATAAYVAALSIGVGLIGLIVVPLADATGSWQIALLICCTPTVLAIGAWLFPMTAPSQNPGAIAAIESTPPAISGLPRTPVILLTLTFTLQSFGFASVVNWSPAALIDSGWSEHTAAIGTSLIGFLNAFGALTISRLADFGDRRIWLATALTVQAAGVFGLALLAGQAGVLWPALFGFGSGASFALLLAMPVYMGAEVRQVATVTVWMMGVGYGLAAVGPWMVGAMRDSAIGLSGALIIVGATGLASSLIALRLPASHTADNAPVPTLQ